ncbi:MAG: phospholipase D-like domain-containing protein [Bacteroidota bacterium]
MAKYLTNKETQATLERIIMSSEKKLILVSPYIKLTNALFARIKTAAEKGVLIKFIYRIDSLDTEELKRLKTIKNVVLKGTLDLHAKCYFNEKEMIITSLNLLVSSEKNWEMGMHIDRVNDKEIYEAALNDVLTIFGDSVDEKPEPIIKQHITTATPIENKNKLSGHCIRCNTSISFNYDKPYCYTCYETWAFWENVFYEENVCHRCGKEHRTTITKPFCKECYRVILK